MSRSNGLFACGVSFFMLIASAWMPVEATAQTTCVRATNKVVKGKVVTALSRTTRSGSCKKGEVSALTGPAGATGAAGADGQLRIYGDGSSGAKVVVGPEEFSDAAPMYTDVVIDSGATLDVPSGTVIRCSGSFVNNGLIRVDFGTSGGRVLGLDSSTIMPGFLAPNPGISARAAMSGESGDSTANRSGGLGGTGLSGFQARLLRYPGPFAGGAGAGGASNFGGRGGGSLVVLCNGSITNNGTIEANGSDAGSSLGTSGGGGGIVILASRTSVTSTNSSTISVGGGDGGDSSTSTAPGGGGGGGIIHAIAPTVEFGSATLDISPGSGGIASTNLSSNPRSGGPGGGASGGNGGNGGAIISGSNTPDDASSGSSGYALFTVADPTSLF